MMAEIRPSGIGEDSSGSCYSTNEIKTKSQVVYVYSKKLQVKTEPIDKDSFDDYRETSQIISDQLMKPCTDRCINLQQLSQGELIRSGGYTSRPEIDRYSSKRDHLSEPKRNWSREAITRSEGKSSSISAQRQGDTIVQPQYEDSRHNHVGITRDEERNTFVRGFVESKGDYDKKQGRLILGAQQRIQEKRNQAYAQEQLDDAEETKVIQNSRAIQYRIHHRKESPSDNTFRVGRKSFTPNKIYPSEQDYLESHSASPRSYNVPLRRRHEDSMSPNAPPNVTIIKKDPAKYPPYETNNRIQENREYESQRENDERERKPPSNPSAEMGRFGGGEKRRLDDEPRLGTESYDELKFKDCFSDDEGMRQDFPLKRMRKEAYQGRREHDDFEFVSRGELAREKSEINHNEHEWQYSNRSRNIEPPDPGKYGRRLSLSDRPCGSLQKSELPVFKDPRYRFTECYVVRGCLDNGCDSYGETCPIEDSKQDREGNRVRKFSPDQEKRIHNMAYVPQSYQRCCCPCCPCYSAFRPGARNQSPVSPRCHPRPPPLSPRHYSSSEFPITEKEKAKSSTQVPAMPSEMQAKLVARSIPHLRRRRNRTVYTHDQIEELEDVFKIKHYLDVDEKGSIAKRLGIRTENVEIWFKNRRAKWRKEMKAVKCSADNQVGHFIESPEHVDAESKDGFGDAESPVTFARDVQEERASMTLYRSDAGGSDDAREVAVDN